MPFGLKAWVDAGNNVLHRGPDPPMGRSNFEVVQGRPVLKYRDTVVVCAKTAEPFEMPFGLWAQMGPRNPVLDGVPDPKIEKAIFWERSPHFRYRDFLPIAVQYTAESIDLSFGLWTLVMKEV